LTGFRANPDSPAYAAMATAIAAMTTSGIPHEGRRADGRGWARLTLLT
jgi:hypothetical protein